jgi:pyruvate,water dikinase
MSLEIEAGLEGRPSAGFVALEQAQDAECYGGKASQLGRALGAGLPVPPGYALSVSALEAVQQGDAAALARVTTIFQALGAPLAARSSGIGEDAGDASFAGQHATVLNIMSAAGLVAGLVSVHASAHAPAALAYRARKGITGPVRIAAVVQKLVDAECAGVLFTRNPVTGADEIMIEAAWGLGEAVVAGLVTPDQYRITHDGRVLEVRVGEKDLAILRQPDGGTVEAEVPSERVHARCLDDAWLLRLAQLAGTAKAAFGIECDLEWAVAQRQLYLLQSRPISTL